MPAVLIIMAVSMRSLLQHELRSRRNEVRSEPASQVRIDGLQLHTAAVEEAVAEAEVLGEQRR